MSKLNLSSPWEIYFHEIEELFGYDPEIELEIDREKMTVKFFVQNSSKAEALEKLIPAEKKFGNVIVRNTIVPANDGDSLISLYARAFFGNPVFVYTAHSDDDTGFSADYVVFENEVVQFFCDSLADVNGNRSTLYQDIAEDVFKDHDGVFFCTDEECDCEECFLLGE